MNLEVGKNYRIESNPSSCGLAKNEGVHRISWQDNDRFMIEGNEYKCMKDCYNFTRLPSFGDKVEVFEKSGNLRTSSEHYFYLGEIERGFALAYSNYAGNAFSEITGCIFLEKQNGQTIRLKSAEPEKVKPKHCCCSGCVDYRNSCMGFAPTCLLTLAQNETSCIKWEQKRRF